MKPRLSFADKRVRLLALFHETKEPYTLKELEKIAPKQKGIVSQSVKEVLDSLVADEMVNCDKIGTSNLFWAFPSMAYKSREDKMRKFDDEMNCLDAEIEKVNEDNEKSMLGREESEERRVNMELLSELLEKNNMLKEQLQHYKDNDPEVWNDKKEKVRVMKSSVNRWTENIFSIKRYLKDTFNVSEEVFVEQFGIDESIDMVE